MIILLSQAVGSGQNPTDADQRATAHVGVVDHQERLVRNLFVGDL